MLPNKCCYASAQMGKFRTHLKIHSRSAIILYFKFAKYTFYKFGYTFYKFGHQVFLHKKRCIVGRNCTNNSEFSCSTVCNQTPTGTWVRNTLSCFRKQVPNSRSTRLHIWALTLLCSYNWLAVDRLFGWISQKSRNNLWQPPNLSGSRPSRAKNINHL